MRKQLLLVVGVAAVIASLVGCTKDTGGTASQTGQTPQPSVQMTISDFKFDPPKFEMAKGFPMTVTNSGNTAHTFTIDGTDVDLELQPGDTATAAVDKLVPGTYTFHCTIHSQMTGSLKIT